MLDLTDSERITSPRSPARVVAIDEDGTGVGGVVNFWRRNAELTRELAWTQFKLKYTGSALGYLWSLAKPALYFGIMYFVFAVLFQMGRGEPNFPVQLLVGIVLWTFFAETTGSAMASLAGSGHLIRKAYFPRAVLVVSATLSSLVTLVLNLALVLIITGALHQLDIRWASLVAPLLLIELYALTLGVSLGLAALFVFYRDIGHIWEIILQVLFYASVIVFPFSYVMTRAPQWARVLAANPMAQIIEDMRHALISTHARWTADILGPRLYLLPLGIAVVALVAGWQIFRKLAPRFAEEL